MGIGQVERRQMVGIGERAEAGHARAPCSYQPRERFTMLTTESITGTSTSTPTTVASAAPEFSPNRLIAAATASSKKLDAPIRAAGAATHPATPKRSEEHTSELQSLLRHSYAVF